MSRSIALSALALTLFLLGATSAQAGIWRHRRANQPAAAQQQPTAPATTTASQAAPARQGSNYTMNRPASVWPVYPNYGNPVGSAYSAAAGLRPGQFFGTFGLRSADARARGAY